MDSAFIQKLVWSVLGVLVYALAAWPPMAPVAGQLILAAGGMLISPWFARPGDGKLIAAGKEAVRASKMPPPFTVATVFACIGLAALSSCATTPTAREALEGAKRAQESLEHVCAELERSKPLREEVTHAADALVPAGVDGGQAADVAPVPEAAPVAQ